MAVRSAGGPDIALVGDGYPLVVEYGPVELNESALRCLISAVPGRGSDMSAGAVVPLPLLVLLSCVSSFANLIRFSSVCTLD